MIRLSVRCRPELAERVLAELLELAPGGVEEDDAGDWVEYSIYGPPGEVPSLPDLEAAAGDGLVEIRSAEIPDDWADRWRDFHRPVSIAGGRVVVRPSWERDAGSGAEVDIRVVAWFALGGVPAMKQTRIYPLSEVSAPVNEFINLAEMVMNTVHSNDFSFFEELDELMQEEPTGALDAERAGQLAAIGLVNGRPFAPDERMRGILSPDALAVGIEARIGD